MQYASEAQNQSQAKKPPTPAYVEIDWVAHQVGPDHRGKKRDHWYQSEYFTPGKAGRLDAANPFEEKRRSGISRK